MRDPDQQVLGRQLPFEPVQPLLGVGRFRDVVLDDGTYFVLEDGRNGHPQVVALVDDEANSDPTTQDEANDDPTTQDEKNVIIDTTTSSKSGAPGTIPLEEALGKNLLLGVKKRFLTRPAARFLHEKRMLEKVQGHPNFARLLAASCDDDISRGQEEDACSPIIITEYCPVGDLTEFILSNPAPLPEADARRVLTQLTTAVAYLHKMNLINGDFKPDNVFLEDFLHVRVGDAESWHAGPRAKGCCPRRPGFFDATNVPPHAHTTTGCSAPEAYQTIQKRNPNTNYNGQCDIWSLGMMLYSMLTREFPKHTGANVPLYEYLAEETSGGSGVRLDQFVKKTNLVDTVLSQQKKFRKSFSKPAQDYLRNCFWVRVRGDQGRSSAEALQAHLFLTGAEAPARTEKEAEPATPTALKQEEEEEEPWQECNEGKAAEGCAVM